MSSELPDLIGEGPVVLFCGINPGMTAATAGHHFVSRSNRFWRVLHLAGFTPMEISPEQDRSILDYGYGLTTVVQRPTASADQLSPHEFATAAAQFRQKIARHAPRFVAFLGKPAYAALSGRREIAWAGNPRAWKAPWSGCCPIPAEEIARSGSMAWSMRTARFIWPRCGNGREAAHHPRERLDG